MMKRLIRRRIIVYIAICICIYVLKNAILEGTRRYNMQVDTEKSLFAIRVERFNKYQQTEANRTGPGEAGDEVKLTKEEVALVESQMRKEGFSRYLNSLVSLDRSLRDYRHEVCKNQTYPWDLPTASVIIIYRNELQRVVLRTVHSVINRTPPQYLKEVILVDDASDREELQKPLDDHINEHWPEGFVRVIRLPIRSGLIRTRLAGVNAATGDVVIMLDGHMEATKGWIEPLLARIKENKKILVAPLVDMIHPHGMKYIPSHIVYQTFTWNMEYHWTDVTDANSYNHLKPLPSYALVGCAMAMHKDTFLKMGAFDNSMAIWGGENVELPIRLWMCGGRVEIIPCSRVAHTYRGYNARPWNVTKHDYFDRNTQRIAEVWLDEYKDEFYAIHPYLKKRADEIRANATDRLELRRRLGCKSFKWLLENVVRPPMFMYTRNVTAWGSVKNYGADGCMDVADTNPGSEGVVILYWCHFHGIKQLFSLTWTNQLRRDTHCLEYAHTRPGYNVSLTPKCDNNLNQQWIYEMETSRIRHVASQLCLDTAKVKLSNLFLNKCTQKDTQKWTWQHYVGRPNL